MGVRLIDMPHRRPRIEAGAIIDVPRTAPGGVPVAIATAGGGPEKRPLRSCHGTPHVVNLVEALAVLLAGVVAGGMNAVVGSGTLVTFPTLLAFGYPPVLANVSNNVGLVPGSASGAYGYREKLVGLGPVVLRLAVASTLGGVTGAILLLYLPPAAFKAIVPVLLGIALVMVVLQPRLATRLAERSALQPAGAPGRVDPDTPPARVRQVGPLLLLGVYGGGIYGGYFGAAQGVLLIGLLGTMYTTDLQEANAIKNVLAGVVNAVAAVVFVLVAEVAWLPAILIAVGSTAGGLLGARYGRRLPQNVLRALIVVIGVVAIVRLLLA
jgi:uncharacterized protein